MKKLAKVLVLLLAGTMMFSCSNSTQEEPQQTETLQSFVDSAVDVADLSGFEISAGSQVEVSKAITLTGGASPLDMKGAKVTVKAAGAKVVNLKNVDELIVDASVGNGDVTIVKSDIKKVTINGGGANSIHVEDTVIASVSVTKEGVRIVLEGTSALAAVDVSVPCVLDSTSADAKVGSLNVSASVKNIEIKGKVAVETIVAVSTDFTVKISSNDVKVTAAVVKTSDGKVAKVKVEASEGVTIKEIAAPADVKIEEPKKEEEAPAEPDDRNVAISIKVAGATGVNQKSIGIKVERINNDNAGTYKLIPDVGYTDYIWYYKGQEISPYNQEDNSLQINWWTNSTGKIGTYPVELIAMKDGIVYGATVYVTFSWNWE